MGDLVLLLDIATQRIRRAFRSVEMGIAVINVIITVRIGRS